jgi:DNA-binding MarR family transcriptional regulator
VVQSISSARTRSVSAVEPLSETVTQLTRGWVRFARERARALGLTLPQLFLLGGLRELGTIPVNRWVERMGTSPSATTALLDGLEATGYVRRTHDAVDRRQVLVSLTPNGRKIAERLKHVFRDRWKALCEDIPERELEAATATLAKIVRRLGADEDGPKVSVRPPPPGRRRA